MKLKNLFWSCLAFAVPLVGSNHVFAQADPAYLPAGRAYKFAIDQEGVYKISYDHLRKIGVDPEKTDPTQIKIFGREGGMVPQQGRSMPTAEIAIFVSGQDDGKFNKEDFILFYAQGPCRFDFDLQQDAFRYHNNLYSNRNFYFLMVTEGAGRRITSSENVAGSFPVVNTFADYAVYELDEVNIRHSGREWYGEKFGLTNDLTLSFSVPGVVPGSQITVISDILGQSYANASFRISLNGTQIGEQPILPITNATYGSKGYDRRDTIRFNENIVGASARNDQQVTYDFMKASGYSQGHLDFVLLNFERVLSLYGNQTLFVSPASTKNAISTFELQTTKSNIRIWDVTNHHQVVDQSFTPTNSAVTFSTSTDHLKKFIAFTDNIPAPEFIGKTDIRDLHALPAANFIIVTHPLFMAEAERLAEHRSSFSNLSVHVVTTEQVYDAFSSGRQDVSAIRNFVKTIYKKETGTLKSLLLFGRGSYDYKDRLTDNTNFVATYESRNSTHPLQTYSSDDFFGFLEEGEGEWDENPVRNHTLDIGVGRLPVKSVSEAKNVIDKIIKYDTDKKSRGYWRKEIVFVADDGSNSDGWTSLHQFQANSLANLVEDLEPGIDTKKMFMGTYKKAVAAGAETAPALADDIQRAFEKGALIINYTGHGSERIWADEGVLTPTHIDKLRNEVYPFLVTATCEFGRQDDPHEPSSAEGTLTRANGGSIGLVTTARPVNATTNFELNRAFYEALLVKDGNSYPSIGEVFRRTKNNSLSGVANRNFSLLGDPSMNLALPNNEVAITSISTQSGSDTLKALSTVIVKGEIRGADGEKLSTFNGEVEGALFDKETEFETIGRNNPVFNFKQWYNILFRGKTTVTNGEFEFQFILPKNISYQVAEGKFSLYAAASNGVDGDAKGLARGFAIGGTETDVPEDHTPPSIELFIGDLTFLPGGIASSDTRLIARLSDANGINISAHGIGNSLVAIIDDDPQIHVLNGYYTAGPESFTTGMVDYPLQNLSPGRHTLTLKAWDTYNNPAEASIEFFVTDGEHIVIESFGNYPNPFEDNTTFYFRHNRSGDDVEAHLFIYSPAGLLINAAQITVSETEYTTDLTDMEQMTNLRTPGQKNEKLPPGIYVARLVLRSLTNGSKNEQVTKLIVLN